MSTTADRDRVPAGVRTGGRFTHSARNEPQVDLDEDYPEGLDELHEQHMQELVNDYDVFLDHLTPQQRGVVETERRSASTWAQKSGQFAGPAEVEAFGQWSAQLLADVDFDPAQLPPTSGRVGAWRSHQAAVVAYAVAQGPQEREWVHHMTAEGMRVPPAWLPQERVLVLGLAERLGDAGLQVERHDAAPGVEVLTLAPLAEGGAAAA